MTLIKLRLVFLVTDVLQYFGIYQCPLYSNMFTYQRWEQNQQPHPKEITRNLKNLTGKILLTAIY